MQLRLSVLLATAASISAAVPSALPGFLFPDQTSISGRNPALNARGDVAIAVAAVPGSGDTVQAIWVHRDGTGGIVYTGTVAPSFEAGFSDVLLTGAGRPWVWPCSCAARGGCVRGGPSAHESSIA